MSDSVPSKRERLDKLLVARGLCETRSKAQALVLAGQVVVDDHMVDKPGSATRRDAAIRIKGDQNPYVSRGGLKLAGALEHFEVELEGRTVLDIGASTGGFTDVSLQHGASKVFAVDVGYGQLAWRLASDERVAQLDRQNIRSLTLEQLGEPVNCVVCDCSFISLTKVLPHVPPLLDRSRTCDAIVLVKPQFEVGPARVGKGGIVRDEQAHADALAQVQACAAALGFSVAGTAPSPIKGREGNIEFLLWLQLGPEKE